MLEAHRLHTHGAEDSDSSNSDDCQGHIFHTEKGGDESPKGTPPVHATTMEPPEGGTHHTDTLDGSANEAISILKKHQEFIRKQRLLAKNYQRKLPDLPRTVSSRGKGGTEVVMGSGLEGGGERKELQTEKNRKRKLKKRKAKEKRFKLDAKKMESDTQ